MDRTPLPPPLVFAHRADTPVVLSVAHAGRDYPPWLIREAQVDARALRSLEDPLVDRLVWRATAAGHGTVVAMVPRAVIDCNRSPDDLDPRLVPECGFSQASGRARQGLGLVPARTAAHGHLWRSPLAMTEVQRRLDESHEPFHRAIERQLDHAAAGHGAALLLDCHSTPPLSSNVELVIGDRHGRSASSWLAERAAALARAEGWSVSINTPFAGGYVVERHGQPDRAIHALQLEFDRRTYCDASLAAAGPGFDRASRLIATLAAALGKALTEGRAIAAE